MAWIVLIASGVMESVWATALGKMDGFSKPLPLIVFIVGLTFSMVGLGYSLRTIPTGTAYSVWTGIANRNNRYRYKNRTCINSENYFSGRTCFLRHWVKSSFKYINT